MARDASGPRVLRSLGAGGTGEVYRARDTRLDRTVALKILPARLAQDAGLRARFQREARAISSLEHPLERPSAASADERIHLKDVEPWR